MRNQFTVIIALLITVISFGCIRRVEQKTHIDFSHYLPLNDGDLYLYSGPLGKCEVKSVINGLYTFTGRDSTGNVIHWMDFQLSDQKIYLKNFIAAPESTSSVHYSPAIPFGPWSALTGDTLLIEAVEIRNDSVNSHLRAMIGYEILGVETVPTPAGEFDDCIKIGISYSSLDNPSPSFLEGESVWWFAKDIGIVKYATAGGTGHLLEAAVDGVNFP